MAPSSFDLLTQLGGVDDASTCAEDRRQAATLAVGIASSVTTAALAALAAIAAVVTFAAGKYHELGVFYVLIAVSALLFVTGIVVGAQGIAEITKQGYKGSWSPFTQKKLFNWQSNITMAGFVFLAVAVVVGFQAPMIPAQAASNSATRSEVAALRERLTRDEALLKRITRRHHDHHW
jgi:hypothetical protein